MTTREWKETLIWATFALVLAFLRMGRGAPDDGLSDARHYIRCLASYGGSSTNIALVSTETHHERIAMGIYDFFLSECLLLVHEVDEKQGLLKFWIKLLHGNEVLNTSYWRCDHRMFAKRVTTINIG
jgi:hypothetical protein